jgi:thiol-disulfide isomerase/thioredoxin
MRQILIALLIGILLILGTSVYVYLESERQGDAPIESLVGQSYRELVEPTGFVNTKGVPVSLGTSLGKEVILLEFMRYGCANCQRSFPTLVSWDETYREKGLRIIAVHTPQFAHEGENGNVAKAMEAAGITFPVVLDNEYQTWQAYGNHYWPRTFIIDTNGIIVHDQVGADDYEATEAKIRELLGA